MYTHTRLHLLTPLHKPPPHPPLRQPLEYDYDQFERLLLGAAWTTYNNRRKAAPGPAGACLAAATAAAMSNTRVSPHVAAVCFGG